MGVQIRRAKECNKNIKLFTITRKSYNLSMIIEIASKAKYRLIHVLELNILTPKQMLQTLPITLVRGLVTCRLQVKRVS